MPSNQKNSADDPGIAFHFDSLREAVRYTFNNYKIEEISTKPKNSDSESMHSLSDLHSFLNRPLQRQIVLPLTHKQIDELVPFTSCLKTHFSLALGSGLLAGTWTYLHFRRKRSHIPRIRHVMIGVSLGITISGIYAGHSIQECLKKFVLLKGNSQSERARKRLIEIDPKHPIIPMFPIDEMDSKIELKSE